MGPASWLALVMPLPALALKVQDVEVSAIGVGSLKVEAPSGALTEGLRTELAKAKLELLALLARPQSDAGHAEAADRLQGHLCAELRLGHDVEKGPTLAEAAVLGQRSSCLAHEPDRGLIGGQTARRPQEPALGRPESPGLRHREGPGSRRWDGATPVRMGVLRTVERRLSLPRSSRTRSLKPPRSSVS